MSTERNVLVTDLVNWIRARGLVSPAILFLQLNKPLAPIGGQVLLLFQPFLDTLGTMLGWPGNQHIWADYAALLESPDDIERLLKRLEEPA